MFIKRKMRRGKNSWSFFRNMQQFKTKVISNKKIAPGHYILSFKTAKKIIDSTKPGQFFNARASLSYEPLLRRPFSAHKIYKDRIEILYKVVGSATKILSTKKKGDRLDIIGPLGNGFEIASLPPRLCPAVARNDGAPVIARPAKRGETISLLVAGGHGVAPLYALAKQLTSRKLYPYGHRRVTVFIGAKTGKHIICDKELRKLGAKVYIATEDGSKGYKGLVTKLLKKKIRIIPRLRSRQASHESRVTIYACGPKPMLKAVSKLAGQYKIPCQVSLEEYMACGIGTCLGCAVKTRTGYKMVCKDGPVFDAREVVW